MIVFMISGCLHAFRMLEKSNAFPAPKICNCNQTKNVSDDDSSHFCKKIPLSENMCFLWRIWWAESCKLCVILSNVTGNGSTKSSQIGSSLALNSLASNSLLERQCLIQFLQNVSEKKSYKFLQGGHVMQAFADHREFGKAKSQT